ncbi:MAG: hypothetical protein HY611_06810 [Elusimicrobia bacterium]|nr:hypothetical protein [Elusimicrobiota bacterium]
MHFSVKIIASKNTSDLCVSPSPNLLPLAPPHETPQSQLYISAVTVTDTVFSVSDVDVGGSFHCILRFRLTFNCRLS